MADVVARGVRLHVQRLGPPKEAAGSTRTVVLVHGLVMDNLSSLYFTLGAQAARLGEVVLFDLRGHGWSERPPSGYGLVDFRDDLAVLLDALGVAAPVHLVGNSFGGLLALALAAEAPERAASLALIDPIPPTPGWGARMAATLSLQGVERDRRIAASFQSWLGRGSERKTSRLARTAEALVHGTSLVRDLEDPARSPALDPAALARIACPVLVLYGEGSDVREEGERALAVLPRGELVRFPGCTHSVLWEATGRVQRDVLAWLAMQMQERVEGDSHGDTVGTESERKGRKSPPSVFASFAPASEARGVESIGQAMHAPGFGGHGGLPRASRSAAEMEGAREPQGFAGNEPAEGEARHARGGDRDRCGGRGGKRFLFVVPPLTGHVNPTVGVAEALHARGHEVAWVAHPGKVRPLLPEGATLFALDDHVPADLLEQGTARARAVRGAEAFKFLWEDFFLPLARAMRPGVETAARAYRPDVLVVDQQALAGAVEARRLGLPWATFATTSAGVVDPLAGLPLVRAWLDERLDGLAREAGLALAPGEPLDRSPHLVVAFTTEALVGPAERFPAHYAFVGPSLRGRPETVPFPWEALRDDVRRVLVSLGTVNAEGGERFYRVVVEAFTDAPFQVVLAAPPELVPPAPANFIVRPFVPQLALLPRMHAVVCHAGHNTTCEALAHGLPLVVAPIKDDQPIVAQQVEAAGAGVRVRYGRVKAAELRAVTLRVLLNPAYASAAARVRASFEAAGGAARAASLLETLA